MAICAKLWVCCFGSGEGMVIEKKSPLFHNHVLLTIFYSKSPKGIKKASMTAILYSMMQSIT